MRLYRGHCVLRVMCIEIFIYLLYRDTYVRRAVEGRGERREREERERERERATLYDNVSARLVPGRSSVYAISRWCVLVKTIVILESE